MPQAPQPRNTQGTFAALSANNDLIDQSLDNLVNQALDRLQSAPATHLSTPDADEIKKTSRLWLLLGLVGGRA